jgi:hypothetical protein
VRVPRALSLSPWTSSSSIDLVSDINSSRMSQHSASQPERRQWSCACTQLIDNTDQTLPRTWGAAKVSYSSAWNTRSATHRHLSKVSSVTVTL